MTRWQQDPRVELVDEPEEIKAEFRMFTRLRQPVTKDWADSIAARRAAWRCSRFLTQRLSGSTL